ncbi:MAG: hypothetical protein A3E78_00560 [Alphaproteobacteria bacterium RIFCSPHIGHO2_12_FULL_63_12]|nr:MAG: hypothetical protein A3E78_00560 [Alphaproteobacteria bacterium RIFCSPHIGHO2_12_FULL_63_12]
MDLKIALTLINQRRTWIFRELTDKNREKSAAARSALIAEVMAVAARYDIHVIEREICWPTTP